MTSESTLNPLQGWQHYANSNFVTSYAQGLKNSIFYELHKEFNFKPTAYYLRPIIQETANDRKYRFAKDKCPMFGIKKIKKKKKRIIKSSRKVLFKLQNHYAFSYFLKKIVFYQFS